MKRLKKLLLLTLTFILSLSVKAQTKIYGNVIYSDNNATPTGIYSFNAEDGLTFDAVKVDEEMNASNGGVYENGKYHFMNMFTYYEYNAETWTQIKKENLGFVKGGPMQATALAYDKTTNKVYGCFMDYNTYSYVFGTVDYDQLERTAISSLGDNIMRCMVCTPDGKLYGINGEGTLYSFDKTTGETTEIGSTGLSISNIQGAICDPKDGTVYWAACLSNGNTGLYTLDLNTASTMLVAQFPNNEEVTGLFILPQANTDGTPKTVTNLKSNFVNGSLTGNFSFTMPTQSNEDKDLESVTDYKVTVDDSVLIKGSAQPGADITTEEVTLTRGHHNISVICSNPSGESLPAYDFPYIGKDTPNAVDSLVCTASGDKAILSWKAVTTGKDNGYMGTVTYDVMRYPGQISVAKGLTGNSFEETVDTTTFNRVYYTVTPCNDGEEYGEPTACDPVTFGSIINPPYKETFNTATSLDGYTVIDANGDGKTWAFEPYTKVTELYSNSGSSDDWLITPAVKLSNDRLYKVALTLSNSNLAVPQNYTVALLAHPKDFKKPLKVIASGSVLNDTKDIHEFMSVPESGNYYIAVNTATNDANLCILEINKLSIDAGTLLSAPGHATDFTAVADKDGALKTELSFTTPTMNLDSTSVQSLSKVELYRNDELIKTFDEFPNYTDFSRGINIRYTDENAEQGKNIYSVVAYNNETRGIETFAETWAGIDIPAQPTNVVAKIVDGGVQIGWMPKTVGVHGGYVDTKTLKYYVENNYGSAVATAVADSTVLDNIDTNGDQDLRAYAVLAYNEAGQSEAAISNSVIIGAPYNLPLSESFASAQTHYFWGVNGSRQANFSLDENNSSDLDNGSVNFNGTNATAELYSGKLDLQGARAVKVSFDYYCSAPQDATLEVEAYSPEHGFKTIGTLDMSQWNSYKWLTAEFVLEDDLNDKDVQIYFVGNSTGEAQTFNIDRIKLEETEPTGITTVKPLNMKAGNVYDIQGRKLNRTHQGQLVINNGHKYLAK